MLRDRIFRGELYCTPCFKESGRRNRHAELFRMDDGSYQALCYGCKPKDPEDPKGKKLDYVWQREHLAMLEMCFHIPWRDVEEMILHKPDPNAYRYCGNIITVVMRDVPNVELMRQEALEVCHGLQIMADGRGTIHQWTEGTEQNACFTDTNYHWEAPATCTIRDKDWGHDRIERFHELCRTMAKIHKWKLTDETMNVLDRIVKAVNEAEEQEQ